MDAVRGFRNLDTIELIGVIYDTNLAFSLSALTLSRTRRVKFVAFNPLWRIAWKISGFHREKIKPS